MTLHEWVVRLFSLDGYPPSRIDAELGMPPGTARAHITRAWSEDEPMGRRLVDG